MGNNAQGKTTNARVLRKKLVKTVMKANTEHKYKWYEFGCKDATYLLTKQNFVTLKTSEKGLLKFHMFTCGKCQKFVKQIQLMENLIKKTIDFNNLTLSIEKKSSINQQLTALIDKNQ